MLGVSFGKWDRIFELLIFLNETIKIRDSEKLCVKQHIKEQGGRRSRGLFSKHTITESANFLLHISILANQMMSDASFFKGLECVLFCFCHNIIGKLVLQYLCTIMIKSHPYQYTNTPIFFIRYFLTHPLLWSSLFRVNYYLL